MTFYKKKYWTMAIRFFAGCQVAYMNSMLNLSMVLKIKSDWHISVFFFIYGHCWSAECYKNYLLPVTSFSSAISFFVAVSPRMIYFQTKFILVVWSTSCISFMQYAFCYITKSHEDDRQTTEMWFFRNQFPQQIFHHFSYFTETLL